MDPSALLKKLDSGDVENILPQVKAVLAGPGNSLLAQRTLARISNLTIKKKNSSSEPALSNDNDIVQLTLFCCQAIERDAAVVNRIEVNSRTLLAFYNILSRLHENDSPLCAVEVILAFLPLVEETLSSLTEADIKSITRIVNLTHSLVLSLSESVFKEEAKSKLSPLDLWDLMLRVSSLVNSDISITYILSSMRSMLVKYENCHWSNNPEKLIYFNRALLDKFITFSQIKIFKLFGDTELVNKAFSMLVPILWQLMRIDLKSGNTKNAYRTISLMTNFAASFFSAHPHHVKCFSIISRILKTFIFQINCLPEEKFFISEVKALLKNLEDTERNVLSPAFTWVLFIGGCVVTSMDRVTADIAALKSFFTTAVLSSIHLFTKCLSMLLLSCSNSVCHAPNGETCPFKGDAALAFKTVNMFIILCMDFKKDNEVEWLEILPLIQDSFDSLELVLSKASEGKCVKEQLLKDTLYDTYYRVGNLCYNTNSWEHGTKFLLQPVKYLYSVEGDISSAHKQKMLAILLRLSVCYEKQGLKKEAKVAVLLHVILHIKCKTAQHKFSSDQWCLLQNADINEAKSTDQFLQEQPTLLKSMCPLFKFKPQFVPHLMLWELSCYAQHKMNGTDFTLNAWLALKASKPSTSLLLEGSALACQALFSSRDTVDWSDLISTSTSSWLSKVSENEKAVALCSMAAHYQMKFLIMAQKHFNENYSKVEDVNIYSANPSTVRRPQDVINPGDVCQVRSSFPNLNLQREQKLMDLLNTAVNYWNDSLEAGLSADHYNLNPIVTSSGENILQIAYLYLLWGYNSAAARAFHICCNFARKMSLDDLLLQALSGLMDIVEVNKECIAEADSLLQRLKDHHKITYLQKVYCTSRAFQALRTNAYSDGLKSLKTIADFKPTPSSLWCYAYAKLLQASYALLPKSKLESSELGSSDSAFVGLFCCIHNIQDRRLSHSPLAFAAVVHQALSTALWIGRYYSRRLMPKEARCYLKPELILALKLGLATRAAEFICELAFVDLLTENVDEAVAKTVDLHSILEETETHSQDNSMNDDSAGEFDEAFSTKEPVALPKCSDPTLGASPSLQANEGCRIPTTQHGSSCTCYMCRNFSVQNVWLMYGHLKAKINALRFFVHQSLDTYKETFKAADLVLRKINVNACESGFLLQQHQVACSVICSKLDFVDMLVMYGKDEQAERQNGLLFRLLNDLKTCESQLLAEALEQKLCILQIKEKKEDKSTSPKTPRHRRNLSTSPRILMEKTPEKAQCMVTPVGPVKKMHPLKPVEALNRLLVPLTNQQFYSPKVGLNLDNLIDSDDNETGQDSKENFSSASNKFFKTPRNKSEISGALKCIVLPDSDEDEEVVQHVTTSKVSKSIRSLKPKTVSAAQETLSASGKSSTYQKSQSTKSSASTSSRSLSVRERSSAKEVLPLSEKPVVSQRATSSRGVNANSSQLSSLKIDPKALKPSKSGKASSSSRPLSVRGTSSAKEVVPLSDKPVASQRAASTRGEIATSSQPSSLKSDPKSLKSNSESSKSDLKKFKSDKEDSLKSSKQATSRLTSDVSQVTNVATTRQTRQRRN